MSALILVVDDIEANRKLLEAKLQNEYYDVITAVDGFDCIAKAKEQKPDIILLDVMMPEMDGFEACGKMKEDPDISHIPVVMVTALNDMSDRVRGLEMGADDFLTKPINDTALLARVKSLVRIKMILDELRLRDQTGAEMGIEVDEESSFAADVSGSRILLVDDDIVQIKNIAEALGEKYHVTQLQDPSQIIEEAQKDNYDLAIISTQLSDHDGLRVCMNIKNNEDLRHVPILMLVDEDDTSLMLKGLEMGINDYIISPVDKNEMHARVKTQIRRKKYQDKLKSHYKDSVSMAITDQLTKLYNRHYLDKHLNNMVDKAKSDKKDFSLMIMDMDHFKSVNDTYGHDVGDEILVELANRIVEALRSTDLAARFGGEEFVILMPETDIPSASEVAERIRKTIEEKPFSVSHAIGQLSKTISTGIAQVSHDGTDTPEKLLKRADTALYLAKETGRNQFKTQFDVENNATELPQKTETDNDMATAVESTATSEPSQQQVSPQVIEQLPIENQEVQTPVTEEQSNEPPANNQEVMVNTPHQTVDAQPELTPEKPVQQPASNQIQVGQVQQPVANNAFTASSGFGFGISQSYSVKINPQQNSTPTQQPVDNINSQITNPNADVGEIQPAQGVMPGTPAAAAALADQTTQNQNDDHVIVNNLEGQNNNPPSDVQETADPLHQGNDDDTRPLSDRLKTYESNYKPEPKKVDKVTPTDQNECF